MSPQANKNPVKLNIILEPDTQTSHKPPAYPLMSFMRKIFPSKYRKKIPSHTKIQLAMG